MEPSRARRDKGSCYHCRVILTCTDPAETVRLAILHWLGHHVTVHPGELQARWSDMRHQLDQGAEVHSATRYALTAALQLAHECGRRRIEQHPYMATNSDRASADRWALLTVRLLLTDGEYDSELLPLRDQLRDHNHSVRRTVPSWVYDSELSRPGMLVATDGLRIDPDPVGRKTSPDARRDWLCADAAWASLLVDYLLGFSVPLDLRWLDGLVALAIANGLGFPAAARAHRGL